MVVQGKTIMEDPPLNPGNRIPPHIQASPTIDTKALLDKIEVGTADPDNIRKQLNNIHINHQKVFDGNLSRGYQSSGVVPSRRTCPAEWKLKLCGARDLRWLHGYTVWSLRSC